MEINEKREKKLIKTKKSFNNQRKKKKENELKKWENLSAPRMQYS